MRCSLKEPFFNLLDLFNGGMDRDYNPIFPVGIEQNYLNLGAGEKNFDWAVPLQLPDWNAETDFIPADDNSVDGIVAFHFFEHITGNRLPVLLSECERVLKIGGTLNIVVPHRLGGMAFQDLDHKSFFTEDTWRILMENKYYKTHWAGKGKLKVHINLIMGDSERTLALVTQMVKR